MILSRLIQRILSMELQTQQTTRDSLMTLKIDGLLSHPNYQQPVVEEALRSFTVGKVPIQL